MPAHDPHHHEAQDRSIKARKHQLFEDDDVDHGPRRTFAQALRETPAAPLDPVARGALWVVGVLVILLLLAAFAKLGTRKPKPRPAAAASRVTPARTPGVASHVGRIPDQS